MRVGFVGAGRMGHPMVRRLVGAGHQVQVLARSAPARARLDGTGARIVGSPAEVADRAAAVLVCVFDDRQVRQVCLVDGLLAAMQRDAVLVLHTTGSPRTAQELARLGVDGNTAVLDAPVSGGPAQVAAGELTLFVGGADEVVARLRPVLASYADPVLHVGPLGAGQQLKLVNNALFAAGTVLVTDALRLGVQLGLPEPVLLDALRHGSGASCALDVARKVGSSAALAGAIGPFVEKDLAVVRSIAGDLGGDLGALAAVFETPTGAAMLDNRSGAPLGNTA